MAGTRKPKLESMFVPTLIDFSDNKSNREQAIEILEQVAFYQKKGFQKVGITYSANLDQANRIRKNKNKLFGSGIAGANQAEVISEIEKLLKTPQYDHLTEVFHILPIATMLPGPKAIPENGETLEKDFRDIRQFLQSDSSSVLLGWQNQLSTYDHPYAVGGGVAARVLKAEHSQRIQVELSKFALEKPLRRQMGGQSDVAEREVYRPEIEGLRIDNKEDFLNDILLALETNKDDQQNKLRVFIAFFDNLLMQKGVRLREIAAPSTDTEEIHPEYERLKEEIKNFIKRNFVDKGYACDKNVFLQYVDALKARCAELTKQNQQNHASNPGIKQTLERGQPADITWGNDADINELLKVLKNNSIAESGMAILNPILIEAPASATPQEKKNAEQALENCVRPLLEKSKSKNLQLFIPVNCGSNHWCLAELTLAGGKVQKAEFWDSLKGNEVIQNSQPYANMLSAINKLNTEGLNTKLITVDINAPQKQKNGYSCMDFVVQEIAQRVKAKEPTALNDQLQSIANADTPETLRQEIIKAFKPDYKPNSQPTGAELDDKAVIDSIEKLDPEALEQFDKDMAAALTERYDGMRAKTKLKPTPEEKDKEKEEEKKIEKEVRQKIYQDRIKNKPNFFVEHKRKDLPPEVDNNSKPGPQK